MSILNSNIQAILWRPSGGLGHCLRNLAWTANKCLLYNCKLYIYGLNKHRPFGYFADDTLDFVDKKLNIIELKTEKDFASFVKEFNIVEEKHKSLINNANYKTGIKHINSNKNCLLVCGTMQTKIYPIIKFKPSFINNILTHPYHYYKNDYSILDNNTNKSICFNISGSYYKALGVNNKKLGITTKDIMKLPKTLTLTYTTMDDKKKSIDCIELSQHSITNIKTIDKAIYGVKNNKKDVTHIVQNRLCSEQKSAIERNITYSLKINGSYYKAFRITNKQLKIPHDNKEILNKIKTLTIKYINTENKTLTYKYEDKEPISLTDIKNVISVIYGIDTYNKNITTRIKEKFLKKHEVIEKRKLDSEEKIQSEVIEEKKEIIHNIIKSKRYIAVHFRYRDKKAKGGPEKKFRDIKNKIKETGISAVFVATDCPTFFDYLVKQLDSKTTVFRYTNPPTKGINIHYNNHFKQGENLYKTLLDIYTCKNAHTFIPSITSGFSKLVYEDI